MFFSYKDVNSIVTEIFSTSIGSGKHMDVLKTESVRLLITRFETVFSKQTMKFGTSPTQGEEDKREDAFSQVHSIDSLMPAALKKMEDFLANGIEALKDVHCHLYNNNIQ